MSYNGRVMPELQSQLSSELVSEILAYFGIAAVQQPNLALLDDLVSAYVRQVPWESASRIAKKADILEKRGSVRGQHCARWPDEFWRDALDRGTGGTCFESNYAFFTLLKQLGFTGYLTVNNMEPTIGCHAAIVLSFEGRPWLADVGLPLYAPLPLDPGRITRRLSPFHDYTVRSTGSGVYRIERSHHPQAYCFTLIDRAVPETAYQQVLADDYGAKGLFLDRVIVSKVVEGHICRFNAEERPFRVERFLRASAGGLPVEGDPAAVVGRFFRLDEQLLQQALQVTGAG